MLPRIEHRRADPPLLESGSTGKPRDAAADDGDRGILGGWGGKHDLLLRERFLDDGPPGGPIRALPRALMPAAAAADVAAAAGTGLRGGGARFAAFRGIWTRSAAREWGLGESRVFGEDGVREFDRLEEERAP